MIGMTRNASIIAVTSGKGGVGKTHISANLGILLARQNRRTCIVDADHGLANINLILGIQPPPPPSNLFEADCDLEKAMFHSDLGVDIFPSASGLSGDFDSVEPTHGQIDALICRLRPKYDVIIIDTAAGVSNSIKHYLAIADHVLLAINPEPTSLTDAFGLIRKMKAVQPFYNIIINRVSNAASATGVYKRFAGTVRKYVGAQVGAIGYISEDSFVSAAVLSQTPVVNYSPNCLATQCLKRIARTLIRKIAEEAVTNPKPQTNQTPIAATADSTEVKALTVQPLKTDHALTKEPTSGARNDGERSKEPTIQALPTAKVFVQNKEEIDPFEMWLSQLRQYFDQKTYTEKTRQYRKRRLIDTLTTMCDQNAELLADLESLVVNTSVKDSERILEQTNLTNRLAKTRLFKEPITETAINQPPLLIPGLRKQNVSKAFSVISKLK